MNQVINRGSGTSHMQEAQLPPACLHSNEDLRIKQLGEAFLTPSQDDDSDNWKEYVLAYEACLNETSTEKSPWYIVPADDKKNARLIVSKIILDRLAELKLAYPIMTEARRKELQAIRKQLE